MNDRKLLLSIKPYLGDAVMATPLVEALCLHGYRVTVMTAGFVMPLLRSDRWEVAHRPLQDRREPWHVFRYANELRRERYDASIVLNRSFRAALIPWLARIPERVGHANEGRAFLLSKVVPFHEEQFEAFSDLDLARALGISVVDQRPKLWLSNEERARGAELAENAAVAVQPGARFPEKLLPPAALDGLLTQLRDHEVRAVLLGGKDEVPDAEKLMERFPECLNLVGKTNLRETLGVLSNLRLMAGSDTGVIHLAAGVGCPTVTAFGPTPFEKWSHQVLPHRSMRAPGGKMSELSPELLVKTCLEALEDR